MTALIAASLNGQLAVVQALLAKGAEVNVKDNEGWTALILASQAMMSRQPGGVSTN